MLLFAGGCKNNKDQASANIIPENNMVAVLTDIHIAEAVPVPMQLIGDSALQFLADHYQYVFEKNHVTQEAFRNSMKYYVEHPKQLDKIYEKVIDNISKMQSKIKN